MSTPALLKYAFVFTMACFALAAQDKQERASKQRHGVAPAARLASGTAPPSANTAPAGEVSRSQPGGWGETYRIGPGDVLQISVWREPEASVSAITVRPDGKISIPLVNEVFVQNLTPVEAEEILAARLSELIRRAQVTVLVKEINSQKVYLIGEVKKEGPVRLQGPTTVLQVLAEAGGLTDYAKRKRIYILRTQNQKHAIYAFDYDAVVRGEKMEQNVFVMPGDTLVVPR